LKTARGEPSVSTNLALQDDAVPDGDVADHKPGDLHRPTARGDRLGETGASLAVIDDDPQSHVRSGLGHRW
jgi:hypothetical protein